MPTPGATHIAPPLADDSARTIEFALPHRRDDFFPRTAKLAALDAALASVKQELQRKVVVVCGPGGFGKTTLVSQWAHSVLDRDEGFFGACYFLDFRGFSKASAITADMALDTILNLNSLKSDIPLTTDLRVHRFRTLAANQRMLLILDNVLDEKILEQLIPTTGCSLVIITTRQPGLSELRAESGIRPIPIDVGPLDPGDAKGLLRKGLGSRVAENPQPVEDIVQACAGWPLLLGAVVAKVDSNRRTLTEVAEEYRKRPTRLDVLGDGIRPIDSRAIFDTSLNLLSDNAKRVFRLLGLRLGQDIDEYAVTLLAESDETVAAKALKNLASVGLIIENGDHYTVHDVFHDYARERLDKEETDEAKQAAFARMLDGYYGCVNYSFDLRNQYNPMVDAEYMSDWITRDQLGKGTVEQHPPPAHWFDSERTNLVNLVQRASTMSPPPQRAPHLAFSMFYFLDIGRYWAEWELVTDLGYQMALELGDAWAQARLLRNIARLKWVKVRDYSDTLRLGPSRDAITNRDELAQCDAALTIYEDSDKIYQQQRQQHPGEAAAKHPREAATVKRELADVYLEQARLDPSISFDQAVRAYRDAEDIFRRYSHWENPVASLSVPLSVAYRHLGRFDEAETCLALALEHAGPPDDPKNVGTYCFALLRQAELQAERHRAEEGRSRLTTEAVLAHYDKATAAFGDHGYLLPEARTLAWQGKFLEELAKFAEARAVWTEAHGYLAGSQPDEGSVVQAWIERLPHDGH
jgi:tetratricopeptide (TPR) repeat protein